MCEKANVLARLTVTHANGNQTIVEIHADASFSKFYRWYKRKAGQSAKNLMRYSSRIDARDLQALGEKISKNWFNLAHHPVARGKWNAHLVEDIHLVVLDARRYTRYLDCPYEELPGGGLPGTVRVGPAARALYQLPLGYTPLQRRMDLLTGKAR